MREMQMRRASGTTRSANEKFHNVFLIFLVICQ